MAKKDKFTNLKNILKQINIPLAYDHFKSDKKVTPPFMAYRELKPDIFNADSKVYHTFLNFEIELVTEKKDVDLEERIEELLTNNNISYIKDDDVWDEDEKIFHIFYEL